MQISGVNVRVTVAELPCIAAYRICLSGCGEPLLCGEVSRGSSLYFLFRDGVNSVLKGAALVRRVEHCSPFPDELVGYRFPSHYSLQ